jgi:uncharacterized protein YecE (DUF72 family)
MTERIYIGCAGWSLSRHDRPYFPEQGSHLERYSQVMNAVEINSSFYRPHKRDTYERWAAATPDHFRFAVKIPRSISHDASLSLTDGLLREFRMQVEGLGPKLGWLLLQLPPKLDFHAPSAKAFFRMARADFDCEIACEARHPGWFGEEATALLEEFGAIRVVADPAKGAPPVHQPTTDNFYIRLHGSPRIYYSSYDDAYLAQMARAMQAHAKAGHSSLCIFDNTAGQQSMPNALTLLKALA